MKKFLSGIVLLGLLFAVSGCSEDADPQFRIKNTRSNKANVQVKTNDGYTINFNDVMPGQLTDYQRTMQGNIKVSSVIQNEDFKPKAEFYAENGGSYTIVILDGVVAYLRIDR